MHLTFTEYAVLFVASVLLTVAMVAAFRQILNRPAPAQSAVSQYNQGTYPLIGYKWVLYRFEDVNGYKQKVYYSYALDARWEFDPIQGTHALTADKVPTEENLSGVYAMKNRNDPSLVTMGTLMRFSRSAADYDYCGMELVEIALYGTVIEGEKGFRAEHAQLLRVVDKRSLYLPCTSERPLAYTR